MTWREAIAYCDWLTGKLRERGDTPEPLRTLLREQRWRVTLPSETEWEKATRGPAPSRRILAWGDELPGGTDNDYANIAYAGIGATCSVGIFPKDRSSNYGCLDMMGNVLEWTRSIYASYPYVPELKREDLKASTNVRRVGRGGAFYFSQDYVRCACRSEDDLDIGSYFGFRVVVAPFFI